MGIFDWFKNKEVKTNSSEKEIEVITREKNILHGVDTSIWNMVCSFQITFGTDNPLEKNAAFIFLFCQKDDMDTRCYAIKETRNDIGNLSWEKHPMIVNLIDPWVAGIYPLHRVPRVNIFLSAWAEELFASKGMTWDKEQLGWIYSSAPRQKSAGNPKFEAALKKQREGNKPEVVIEKKDETPKSNVIKVDFKKKARETEKTS